MPATVLAIGKAVPWGELLDFFDSLLPEGWKGSRIIKLLRVMNPVGLGGVAVDSAVTVINVAMGNSDEREIDRLVERMKKGPAAVFADFGENLADAVFDYFQFPRGKRCLGSDEAKKKGQRECLQGESHQRTGPRAELSNPGSGTPFPAKFPGDIM